MLIKDIRDIESDYALDTHGFTVRTLPKVGDVVEGEKPEGEYFDKISEMIKEMFVDPNPSFCRSSSHISYSTGAKKKSATFREDHP